MSKAGIISACGRVPFLGPTLRRLAGHYQEGSITTVRNGHLKGYRWKRSHRYVNGYWLGIYELAIQECLVRELTPGGVFYDVGANAGFFTLLGSKCVGPEGRVFAFEPLPENIRSIRAQVELNHVANCTIVEAAVSDHEGSVEFSSGRDTSTAHIGGMRDDVGHADLLSVEAVTLDHFSGEMPPPDFVKMDIEGAELLALRGAIRLLSQDRPPKMLIEFHGDLLKRDGCSMLEGLGYRLCSVPGNVPCDVAQQRHVLCIPSARKL